MALTGLVKEHEAGRKRRKEKKEPRRKEEEKEERVMNMNGLSIVYDMERRISLGQRGNSGGDYKKL